MSSPRRLSSENSVETDGTDYMRYVVLKYHDCACFDCKSVVSANISSTVYSG